MDWTEERVALLKECWAEGLSASQIAERLGGGTTRNAVIGKAHRLGLAKRPSPIKRSPEGSQKAKTPRATPKKGATVLDLTERMCRWPIGHPGERDFHFCGRKTVQGLPYCAEHAAIAYQSAPSRKDDDNNGGGGKKSAG